MKVETRVDGSNSALCFHQNECKLMHSKKNDPSVVACALPRASKNKLLEWGLPTEELICKRQIKTASTITEVGPQNRTRKLMQRSKKTLKFSLKEKRHCERVDDSTSVPSIPRSDACSVPNHRLSFAGVKRRFRVK